jgi:hypothetical protein
MVHLAMVGDSSRLVVHCPVCNRVDLQFGVTWLAARMTYVCFIDFGIVRLTHSITANDSDVILCEAIAFGQIMISSIFRQIIDGQRSQCAIICEDGMATNMSSSHYDVMMYAS